MKTDVSKLNQNGEDESDKWKNKTEYILSCFGFAIGVSVLYRFPYLCYRNGGGAFLIPYIVMTFTCAVPIIFMETTIGQFLGSGYMTFYELCPMLKGIGYALAMLNLITPLLYNVMGSYSFLFIYNSFHETLPWSHCNNLWNTENCTELNSLINKTIQFNESIVTAANEFFHNHILQISPGIEHLGGVVMPIFIATLLSMVITYLCVIKGIRSVGKVVYFTATFPCVILLALLIRGITLPGAWEGIKYFIYPQWKYLLNIRTWSDAANQVIFGFGPGTGVFINMASCNDFRNNNKRDAIFIPMSTAITSIISGFVVFSVLGYMSHKTGIPISNVLTGGPELAFVIYPEAISMLPLPQLWAVLFFVMCYLFVIDTNFAKIETTTSYVCNLYPVLKKKQSIVSLMFCIIMFLISIILTTNGGMYVWQLVEWYAPAVTFLVISILEFIIVMWMYGANKFINDLEFMLNEKLHWWWSFTWKYLSPIILVFMLCITLVFTKHVTYNGVIYPDWTVTVGWIVRFSSFILIPGYALYKIIVTPGSFIERFKSNLIEKWQPAPIDIRNQWKLHKTQNIQLITMKKDLI